MSKLFFGFLSSTVLLGILAAHSGLGSLPAKAVANALEQGLPGAGLEAGVQNPCNPCKKKPENPCNPCAKKDAANPCNPCSKVGNPCNPCNPCRKARQAEMDEAVIRAIARFRKEPEEQAKLHQRVHNDISGSFDADSRTALANSDFGNSKVDAGADPDPDVASVFTAGRPLIRKGVPNPLLEGDCRQQAVENAYVHWELKQNGTKEQFEAHRKLWKEKIISAEGVKTVEYLNHIAQCDDLCGPIVTEIMYCHIVAVSHLEHIIVLFRYASDLVSPDEAKSVDEVASRLKADPGLNVLLVGRASKLSKTGSAAINKTLAGNRAIAVQDRLKSKGIAPSRIDYMALGWEEPHIHQSVADAYGYETLFAEEGIYKLNQSVIAIIYSRKEEASD